jgi:hypothetical protein
VVVGSAPWIQILSKSAGFCEHQQNWLVQFKILKTEKLGDKLEKASNKSKISVGLSFFIQKLNFK